MRIVDAIRPGLVTQEIKPGRGLTLPEGRWGRRYANPGLLRNPSTGLAYGQKPEPYLMVGPGGRRPIYSTKPVGTIPDKPPVTMADKANKVIEKQFNK